MCPCVASLARLYPGVYFILAYFSPESGRVTPTPRQVAIESSCQGVATCRRAAMPAAAVASPRLRRLHAVTVTPIRREKLYGTQRQRVNHGAIAIKTHQCVRQATAFAHLETLVASRWARMRTTRLDFGAAMCASAPVRTGWRHLLTPLVTGRSGAPETAHSTFRLRSSSPDTIARRSRSKAARCVDRSPRQRSGRFRRGKRTDA
jgi:hypothetical protein